MSRPERYYEQWPDRGKPEPEGGSRWIYFLIGALIGLCALAACAAAAYAFLLPALEQPTRPAPPAVPTLPGEAETATAEVGQVTEEPPATDPPSPAATATVEPDGDAVRAVFVVDGPDIDGRGDDWPQAPTVRSAFVVHTADGWDGSDDLEATWRLAWDESNLYLLVEVVDDVHVQTQSGTQLFRGDSVEVQVDTNPQANAQRVNPATYQFILSPGDFDGRSPAAVRFRGTQDGNVPEAPGHSVRVAAVQTDEGYMLEAAIPWRDMNVAPQEGMVLGLALNANDNDTPGTARQEVMKSNMPGRTLTNPSTWGTLRLE
ncbi:MAG TPA: sugar-binding protein [Candidatus Sulfomarinibacteraceae bacterium]|nr:sugar-binding protein [Candidatus Sulfomarinibacteraceae bacterium]